MSRNEVNIVMTAQDAEQVRAWMRAKQGIKETADELERAGRQGRNAGKSTTEGFASVLPTIGQVAAGITGIGSAVGGIIKFAELVKQQYQEMLARQAEAASAQLGVTGNFRAAVSSFVGRPGSPAPNEFFDRMVRGANGVELNNLFRTFTGAMGSAGNVSVDAVQQATLESARLRPDLNEEDREALVRSTLMLHKEFKKPITQTMAAVIQASSQDSTATLGDFAKNIVPTVVQARAFGSHRDTFESIMANVQAIGAVAGDPKGRRTGNAFINALQTVKEETLKAGLVGKDATIDEQLEAVRQNKKLQMKVLGVFAEGAGIDEKKALELMRKNNQARGVLGGEARTFIAGVEFLSGNQNPETNPFARERKTALEQNLGISPKAVEAVENLNKQIASAPVGQLEEIERSGRQAKNRNLFGQFDAAQEQSIRNLLYDIRYRSGRDVGDIIGRNLGYAYESIRGVSNLPGVEGDTPQERRLRAVRQEAGRVIAREEGFQQAGRTSDEALVTSLRELIGRLDTQIELLKNPPLQKVEAVNRTNQPAAPPAGRLRNGD